MVRSRLFVLAGALLLSTLAGASAQGTSQQQSGQQVCQARADALNMTRELRNTYIRECLAGERLIQAP